MDTDAMLALTRDAIDALDVFERGLREHGNREGAMASVIVWLRGRA